MKKKNLKSLKLTKSTISSFRSYGLNGGTGYPVDATTIIIVRTTDYITKTGCSLLMACDSVEACPQGVAKTKFVDTDTQPATGCIRG